MATAGDLVSRVYGNLKGVDFGSDPGMVDLSRSPDALNVWRNYQKDSGTCIQTRPGYMFLGDIGTNINGFYVFNSDKALVHSGNVLYLWTNFPEEPITTELSVTMNNRKSYMFSVNDGDVAKVYIIDGINYLVWDGTTLSNVADNAYVPTTTISRSPRGGGERLDDVNMLTGQRKNTFVADGESTKYYLDTTRITSVDEVKVDGAVTAISNFSLSEGWIEFAEAPRKPDMIGQDNIEVTFTKTIIDYLNRILHCTIAIPFDNRIFFSGNPAYPNAIFHSSLNNPAYCSDLDYYEDGTTSAIKSLVVGNNVLWALKESSQNNDAVFYHTPTTDSESGRIYPRSQGNVAKGCYVSGYNFMDSIVFLSKEGLEGIGSSIGSLQILTHKSTNIDNKMVNMSNYDNAVMCEWAGYLVIAIDDNLFLADSRQMFQNNKGIEYEWYYWKINNNITFLRNYNNDLYFGTDTGNIYKFGGHNDNGIAINSYWTTPYDQMKYPQFRKTTNKRGNIAKVKNIQNGKLKIWVKTDRKDWKLLKEISINGFDFNGLDFDNFSFGTGDNLYVVFRVKMKKIKHITFKFSCDELDKGFGLYQLNTSAYLGSFVK